MKSLPVLLAASGVAAGLIVFTTAQAATQTLHPSPTGDDTAQLQAALSSCPTRSKPCDIRLSAGVFHTDVLLANRFFGAITGAGIGETTIQPVLDRALRSTPTPFTQEPTLKAPYPVLMHFNNNSKVAVSKLTFNVPRATQVMPYEVPYVPPGSDYSNTLAAAILVEGDREAELVMSSVKFIGHDNASYDGSNLASAARLEGKLRYRDGVLQRVFLERGRLVAFHTILQRTGFGIQALNANQLLGVFVGNTMDTRIYAVSLQDIGGSKVAVVDNLLKSELSPVFIGQTPETPPSRASEFLIAKNTLRVNETGGAVELDPTGGYSAVGVFDFSAYSEPVVGETFKHDVTIWDNDVWIGKDPVQSGVYISGDGTGHMSVLSNRFHGAPYDSAIYVDLSRGTVIAHNDLRDVHAPSYDVLLTPDTRDCVVFEPRDRIRNDGRNNEINGESRTVAAAASLSGKRAPHALVRPAIGYR